MTRIVVVGRDIALWVAAASLQRALGPAGIEIRAIELPTLLQPLDSIAAVPSIVALHRMLGLNETAVQRICGAVPMVGQRYSNWSGAAAPFVIGFDTEPPGNGDLHFGQYWLKGKLEGLNVPFEDFSLGSVAARQGRVPVPVEASPEMPSAGYGYHLEAGPYAGLLRRLALEEGVSVTATAAVGVERDGDRIAAVVTADGERFEAELYVDASGAEAALIGELSTAFEDWRDWLPCDRILCASAPALSQRPAFSQVSAFAHGWVGLYPLLHRTAITAVYASSATDDAAVAARLSTISRLPVGGDVVVSSFRPGMRPPWVGNVVAVGEAAAVLDPLDAMGIHLVHGGISHLIAMLPASFEQLPEAATYNRLMRGVVTGVRDFQAAHYALNRRFDEPLWDAARDAAVPASLQRRLGLFTKRGLITLMDEEPFEVSSWSAMMFGHGLVPDSYDPRVDILPDADHIGLVQQRLRDVAGLVRSMPTVDQFLDLPATAVAS